MKASVSYSGTMPLRGIGEKSHVTLFDTSPEFLGTGSASSPVEVLLESLASCSMIDVLNILAKKRRQVRSLVAKVDAVRAETHPRVFTSISINYELSSPDCPPEDLRRAIELSIDRYCSIAAMLRNGGCAITWSSTIN